VRKTFFEYLEELKFIFDFMLGIDIFGSDKKLFFIFPIVVVYTFFKINFLLKAVDLYKILFFLCPSKL
jgi:hypothetical protein